MRRCLTARPSTATPSGIGKEASGIHVFFFPERHEDVDIRVNSYVPAMLPGGTAMFQRGFKEHDKGIDGVASSHNEVK